MHKNKYYFFPETKHILHSFCRYKLLSDLNDSPNADDSIFRYEARSMSIQDMILIRLDL